jgi:uncharacterized membrane protein YccC
VHLALLSRADREHLSPLRHAQVLAAVSVSERMRLEVERLLSIAHEPLPHRIREMFKPQLQAILDAIDAALVIDEGLIAGGLEQAEETMPDVAGPIYSMLEAYDRRVGELHPQFIADAQADELTNLSAFVLGLQRIGRLFIHTAIPLSATARKAARPDSSSAGSRTDLARVRYCLKLAAAIALAFVVGVTTQRGDLTTILWTVIITGLPTYGRLDTKDDPALRRRRARRNFGTRGDNRSVAELRNRRDLHSHPICRTRAVRLSRTE